MTWSTSFLFLDKFKRQKSSNCSFFSPIVRQGFHYGEEKRGKNSQVVVGSDALLEEGIFFLISIYLREV